MKYILVLFLSFTTTSAWAEEFPTNNLICYTFFNESVSCVSKASIEKDKLQSELLRLQIEEIKKSQAKEKEKEEAKAKKK